MNGTGVKNWAYDYANNIWLPVGVDALGRLQVDMGAISLDDLGDVNCPAPADDDILRWVAAAAEWQNIPRGYTFKPIAGTQRVWRMIGVGSTPRTATIQAVAGAVITLTANVAFYFYDPLMNGVSYVKIANTSKVPPQYAWATNRPAANQLTVTDGADIAGWVNPEIISTAQDGVASNRTEVDLSPVLGAARALVSLNLSLRDTGGAPAFAWLYDTAAAAGGLGQYSQGAALWIAISGLLPVSGTNRIFIQDSATGAATLSSIVLCTAYLD